MKILLTGHKGFIGQNMFGTLKMLDHDVVGYDVGTPTLDGNIPVLPDISQFDLVIHMGAISSTQEKNVDLVLKYNYDFTCMLFDLCEYYGVDLQFASSASIYGNSDTPNRETDAPRPVTPYAWSKYLCERYLLSKDTDINVQCFRYFNVYGDGNGDEAHKGNMASPIHKFLHQCRTNGVIRLFQGSENIFRDFIHVRDLIDIQLKFLGQDVSGVFNIGSGETKSFVKIAEEVVSRFYPESGGFKVRIKKISFPEEFKHSYQYVTHADMSKTRETLLSLNNPL